MPKTYKPVLTESITAAINVEEYRFIGFDGNYCGDKQKALGICDVSTEQGQQCPVNVLGILLVKTAGTITRGAKVSSNASGYAVPYTNGEYNGFSLDDAVTGEIIRIARGI